MFPVIFCSSLFGRLKGSKQNFLKLVFILCRNFFLSWSLEYWKFMAPNLYRGKQNTLNKLADSLKSFNSLIGVSLYVIKLIFLFIDSRWLRIDRLESIILPRYLYYFLTGIWVSYYSLLPLFVFLKNGIIADFSLFSFILYSSHHYLITLTHYNIDYYF